MIPENVEEFKRNLSADGPSEYWPETLKALWYSAKGDWETSHDIAQDIPSSMGSWIHAYLHRVEGDEWNAAYWYRKAGKPFSKCSLEMELQELVEAVLLN